MRFLLPSSLLMLLAGLSTATPASAQTARIAARSHSAQQPTPDHDADHFGLPPHREPLPKDTVKSATRTPAKGTPAKKRTRKRAARR